MMTSLIFGEIEKGLRTEYPSEPHGLTVIHRRFGMSDSIALVGKVGENPKTLQICLAITD